MIYVDLDGVLADYDGRYRELTGGNSNDKGKVRRDALKAHPHFYRDLPLLPDAMQLWNFVKPYHPSILSAQSYFLSSSRQDKHEWTEQHLGLSGPRVIVCNYPTDKQKYARPGDILIDDNLSNCEQWEKAGGIAVHHTSAADSIQKLKAIFKLQENVQTFAEFIQEL